MIWRRLRAKQLRLVRRWAIFGLLLLCIACVSGCRSFSYYRQAIAGQWQLWADAEKIDKILQDPDASDKLKERLGLILELRTYAEKHLSLPVNGHYRKYVDVHRPYVVWNVKAAPEFSMEPKTWWYPVVGSLEYRGYFAEKGAIDYGNHMKTGGYDVYVGGATAYSTLGWFKDPVLNTFLFFPEADVAETLFHELAHQQVFARGDTDFNEAFATTVGQVGARRWLGSQANPGMIEEYEQQLRRNEEFVRIVMNTRTRLEALFGDHRDENGKVKASRKQNRLSPAEKSDLRNQKQRILEQLQADYASVKASWNGNSEYDGWFAHEINNAKLNSVAAYFDLVPGFERLLELCKGDLKTFYAEAERLSKKPKKERHQWLRVLGRSKEESRAVEDKSEYRNSKVLPDGHQTNSNIEGENSKRERTSRERQNDEGTE